MMINISLRKNYQYLIHPILFGLYPLIYLYSVNFTEISINELIFPFLILLGIASTLLLVSIVIFRHIGKSSLLVSFFLYLFLSYDNVYDTFIQNVWSISQNIFIFICVTCFILYAILVVKSKKYVSGFNLLYNIFIISLCTASLLGIFKAIYLNYNVEKFNKNFEQIQTSNNVFVKNNNAKRDIYYLIFDQYARSDILKKYYNYDNSSFINSLENMGFYVAKESYSNYPHTLHSLASSLNMEYINYLTEQQRGKGNWPRALQILIKNNKVVKLFKSIDYKSIDLGHFDIKAGLLSKNINKEISNEINRIIENESTIIQIIYDKSILPILLRNIVKEHVVKSVIVNQSRLAKHETILSKFKKLNEIPDIKEPTFTILHLLIPYHSPFVFDGNGNFVTLEEEKSKTKRYNYIEQVQFVNGKLLELLEIIIEKSDPKPIIIIQSDEGSYPKGYSYVEHDLSKYSNEIWKHKFAILNAYYFPEVDDTFLYPSITPVNTFRLIFNLYFDKNYDLLPDKHYKTNYANFYRFLDVTDKIKNN